MFNMTFPEVLALLTLILCVLVPVCTCAWIISKQLANLNGRMDGLDARMDDLKGEVNARIDGLKGEVNARIDGLKGEVNARIDGLTERVGHVENELTAIRQHLLEKDKPKPKQPDS